MQSNITIHINPNFVSQINGERQHIHINPSFVQGFNNKSSVHHLKESYTGFNAIANHDKYNLPNNKCSVPQVFCSESPNFVNKSFPSAFAVKPGITMIDKQSIPAEGTDIASPTVPLSYGASHLPSKFKTIKKSCSTELESLSLPASQIYRNSIKYKLNRNHKTLQNNVTNSYTKISPMPLSASSSLFCNKNMNRDSKVRNFAKNVKCDFQNYCNNSKYKLDYKTNVFYHQKFQNCRLSRNKYVINRTNVPINCNKEDLNTDIKQKINSHTTTIPVQDNISSSISKFSMDKAVINIFPELMTPQSGNLLSSNLNNSKFIASTNHTKRIATLQSAKKPIFPYIRGSSAMTLVRKKENLENNSRYKLVINSHSKNFSNLGTITKASDPTTISKPTSTPNGYVVKSRTKLIHHRSANTINNQNFNFCTYSGNRLNGNSQSDKISTIDLDSPKQKQILRPLRKGALLKAHQNMIMKKLLYRKVNIRPTHGFNSAAYNKYTINNKFSTDMVKKYVINRKHNVNNMENDMVVRNQTFQLSSVDPRKAKGDVISKYKIMRQNQICKKKQQSIHNELISKYKINRKISLPCKKQQTLNRSKSKAYSIMRRRSLQKSDKFINIGGSMYKSTRTSLKKHSIIKNGNLSRSSKSNTGHRGLNNVKFKKSKFLQSSVKSICTSKPGMLTEILRLQKLGLYKKSNEFCMFYARFGKCKRKEEGICPFVHDPDKIAICTRFLRGTCKISDCPFSHKLDKSKMPVCSHFLNGTCHKDECLYRHVNVNPKAPVCRNFLKGHCPHGEECKKKHILICEEFQSSGKCSQGVQCPLSHRMKRKQTKPVSHIGLRKRQTSVSSITAGNVKCKRRISCKVGVLGMQKLKHGDLNILNKSSKISARRYFEPRNMRNEDGVIGEINIKNRNPSFQQHQINEVKPISSNLSLKKNAIFELKRKRLLMKVEKLKSLYSVGLEDDAPIKVINNDSNDLYHLDEVDTDFHLWRIPLPKVLPSFIPLVMPKMEPNT